MTTRRIGYGWRLAAMLGLLALGSGAAAAESVCARVVIEIVQELTTERQGFEARLGINNGLDGIPIENVRVDVAFTDADGEPVVASSDPANTEAAFFIRQDRLTGIAAVDGAGSVAPRSTAEVTWLIVPAAGSAGTTPTGKLYFVGATIHYRLSGEDKQVTVTPDSIWVRPLPRLVIDYFLPRDVYADDPFTPQIEPVEPFPLGVRVRNSGLGTAWDLAIESAQPRIIENELGLLIDFRITGSLVDDQPVAPTLTIDFGDLDGGAAVTGRWVMETTLSGEFVEFSAEYSHADELGGALTSLLESVTTHRLVHDVLVDLPGRDAVRDFLARDGDGLRVYESNGVDTPVTDQSAAASLTAVGGVGDEVGYELVAPATPGFFYVELPDPQGGGFDLTAVRRADGKRLPAANAWTSRRSLGDGQWEHRLHLFDADTGGRYQLGMAPRVLGPLPPVLQFIPNRTVQVGRQVAFLVEASDPNGTVPTVAVQPLPPGAAFFPDPISPPTLATMIFDWTPTAADEAAWDLRFTASDDALTAARTARIIVCGQRDTDCDGMDDDWERDYFRTLDRDGSGDRDDDGVSDLDEYRNGTDPTVPDASVALHLPAGLSLFSFPGAVPPERASCRALLTALGETGEGASLLRIDAVNQRIETCRAADGTDFPLVTGEGYAARLVAGHDLSVPRDATCPAPSLYAGVNLLGHPSPAPDLTCYGWLAAQPDGQVRSIQRFDPTDGRFATCAWRETPGGPVPVGVDFPIRAGEAYRITAPTSGPLLLPGCP